MSTKSKATVAEPTKAELDKGEKTGIERLDKKGKPKAAAPVLRRTKEAKTTEKQSDVKGKSKKKASRTADKKKMLPGPKKGFHRKDPEKYPNSKYMFDALFSRSKKIKYEQMRDKLHEYFKDHPILKKQWFENRKAKHLKQGYVSKLWYYREGKGSKAGKE